MSPTANPRLVHFVAGPIGPWRIRDIRTVIGESLPLASALDVVSTLPADSVSTWHLRGATSNERYVTREEKTQLVAKQEGLGRPSSTFAALIPIKKSAAWWALTQDERRAIFEEKSHHTQIGLDYLPSIARRLHHCRDLSTAEPFDFITWFEYPAAAEASFDRLLGALRATPEWTYVEREVDIRLEKLLHPTSACAA
jgi:chlorite dismutase